MKGFRNISINILDWGKLTWSCENYTCDRNMRNSETFYRARAHCLSYGYRKQENIYRICQGSTVIYVFLILCNIIYNIAKQFDLLHDAWLVKLDSKFIYLWVWINLFLCYFTSKWIFIIWRSLKKVNNKGFS